MNLIRFSLLLTYLLCLMALGTLRAQTNTTPTGLSVNVTYGGSICLQWTANTTTAIPYEVERSDDGRNNWTKVGDSQPVASSPFSGGNYCDENLPSSRTYFYRVHGSLGRGAYTGYSNTASGTTKAAPPIPSVPLLTAQSGSIRVSWTTQLSTIYELERRDGQQGAFQVIHTENSARNSSITFISNGNAGQEYCFRVRAKDPQLGTSDYTRVACETIPNAATNIRNFTANANGSPNSIKLTWDRYGKESPITIERRDGQTGAWNKIKDWLADSGEYTDTGLQANKEYCYRIQESGRDVSETKCATTAQLVPEPPRNLRVTVNSSQKITLNWDQSTSTFANGYYIEVADNQGGNYTRLDEVNGVSNTQYVHDNLTASKQYCYRVKTKYGTTLSNASNEDCKTTQAPPVTKPALASDLTATAKSSSDIELSWKDNSNNETGFEIERSEDGGRTWKNIRNEGQNAMGYTDRGLTASTQYCYRVQAVNTAGSNGYTEFKCAITQSPPIAIPSPPTNLVLQVVDDKQIKLAWKDNSDNETNFAIERSTDGKRTWQRYKDVDRNITSYDDGGLNASTEYCYRVFAYNTAGNSRTTDELCNTTQAPPAIVPRPPTNLKAEAVSASQINLSWTASNSTFGNGYVIEQASPQGGPYRAIAEVNGLSTSAFSVTGLAASTQYCFRLRTRYTTNSDVSNEACQTTQAPPVTLPRPPSNLSVTASSPSQINLSWADNSDNESRFEIWWATSQTAQFTKLTDVPTNQKEYNHTGLNASSQYCYQIRAVNSAGESSYAGPQCATTPAPPPTAPDAPANFAANALSTTQISLSWKDNSTNETGFELQFSLNNADPWTSLPSQTSNVTTFTHLGLTANTRYYYRLRAVNGTLASAWVTANAITPALPLPSTNTDLKAEVVDYDQIKLTWGAITNNPTGIVIERATSPTGSFTQVGQVAGTAVTFTDTGLPEKTTFYYRIRSTNVNGPSGNSNVAFATTPEAIIAVRPQPLPEGIYAHVDHGTLLVTLNWNQFQEARLRFIGLNGREQLTDQCRINGGTLFQYDVAHLPGGVYVLCLDTDKNRYTKKIWIP